MALIVGAHLRNEQSITSDDRRRFALGGFTGAVVMWYQKPEEVLSLGINPASCVVRLPDSEYTDWNKGGAKYIVGWEQYVADCLMYISRFYAHGFRLFQVDNEPNLVWPAHGKNHWDWVTFLADALPPIVAGKPKDALLGSTPMSHPSLHPEWIQVLKDRLVGSPKDNKKKGVLGLFDWASSHCYWQAAGDLYADWAGMEHKWLHLKTGLPVYITEAGNSSIQSPKPPSSADIEARQIAQYPKYIQALRPYANVRGVYFYLLGGKGWEGFYLTEQVCASIGSSLSFAPSK